MAERSGSSVRAVQFEMLISLSCMHFPRAAGRAERRMHALRLRATRAGQSRVSGMRARSLQL